MSRGTALRAAALILLSAAAACEGERPPIRMEAPAGGQVPGGLRTSDLQAGPASSTSWTPAPFQGNAQAVAEGERLYGWFNCAGCHGGAGGGGIGPPFADDEWIYGGAPAQIHQSIVQGRPNGMPAFGGRIADQEIWKIVAYVRSLSGAADGGAGEGERREPGSGGAEAEALTGGEAQ